MNSNTLRALAILSLAITLSAAATPARAQSGEAKFFQSGSVHATIPFAFTAGEATLPAGEYTIQRVSETSGALLIRSEDGTAGAAVLAASTLARGRTSLPGKLVFHRYEGTYFLAEVWTASSAIGREVSMPKAEKALARQGSESELVAVVTQRQ